MCGAACSSAGPTCTCTECDSVLHSFKVLLYQLSDPKCCRVVRTHISHPSCFPRLRAVSRVWQSWLLTPAILQARVPEVLPGCQLPHLPPNLLPNAPGLPFPAVAVPRRDLDVCIHGFISHLCNLCRPMQASSLWQAMMQSSACLPAEPAVANGIFRSSSADSAIAMSKCSASALRHQST